MQDFTVIRTKDSEPWHTVLSGLPAGRKSVYDTPEYLRVFEKIHGFQGGLFSCEDNDTGEYAAYPHLLRGFDSLDDVAGIDRRNISDCDYRDVVSTWYYGGAKGKPGNRFFQAFHEYCRERKVVTEFVRIDPYTVDPRNYPDAEYNRDVVWVDLTDPSITYKHRCRKAIKQAVSSGVRVLRVDDDSVIDEFAEMYATDMKQKNASPFYRFSREFFRTLFESLGEHATLFVAYKDDRMIAGTVLLHRYRIASEYLRGSRREYLDFRPNNLLVHTQIEWARENGYTIYDLGGGMRSGEDSEADSLLMFKKSFSNLTKPFHVWKKVHDEKTYSTLTEMRGRHPLPIVRESFFPSYREGLGEIG